MKSRWPRYFSSLALHEGPSRTGAHAAQRALLVGDVTKNKGFSRCSTEPWRGFSMSRTHATASWRCTNRCFRSPLNVEEHCTNTQPKNLIPRKNEKCSYPVNSPVAWEHNQNRINTKSRISAIFGSRSPDIDKKVR